IATDARAASYDGIDDHPALPPLPTRRSSDLEVGGDSKGERNIAKDSDLPRGEGLAAKYPADVGIDKDPAVIFADDFEEGTLGARWDETRNQDDKVLSFVDESSSSPVVGKRSLRVRAELGENTGGGFTKWFESADRLHIRFYTKFATDCDYVHHFATLRANRG